MVAIWSPVGNAAVMGEPLLPEGFESLESFVAGWAFSDLASRDARRGNSTENERHLFYDAASPLLESALDYLDTKPLCALSGPDERLMMLMLSLAHVALAREVQQEDEERHAFLRSLLSFKIEI